MVEIQWCREKIGEPTANANHATAAGRAVRAPAGNDPGELARNEPANGQGPGEQRETRPGTDERAGAGNRDSATGGGPGPEPGPREGAGLRRPAAARSGRLKGTGRLA